MLPTVYYTIASQTVTSWTSDCTHRCRHNFDGDDIACINWNNRLFFTYELCFYILTAFAVGRMPLYSVFKQLALMYELLSEYAMASARQLRRVWFCFSNLLDITDLPFECPGCLNGFVKHPTLDGNKPYPTLFSEITIILNYKFVGNAPGTMISYRRFRLPLELLLATTSVKYAAVPWAYRVPLAPAAARLDLLRLIRACLRHASTINSNQPAIAPSQGQWRSACRTLRAPVATRPAVQHDWQLCFVTLLEEWVDEGCNGDDAFIRLALSLSKMSSLSATMPLFSDANSLNSIRRFCEARRVYRITPSSDQFEIALDHVRNASPMLANFLSERFRRGVFGESHRAFIRASLHSLETALGYRFRRFYVLISFYNFILTIILPSANRLSMKRRSRSSATLAPSYLTCQCCTSCPTST